MGRKIPARKHMGVRDPLKQSQERYALWVRILSIGEVGILIAFFFSFFRRIKDKINNPPVKRDDQKVSHSLARFMKLKEAAATNAKNKKKAKNSTKAIVDNEDKPGKKVVDVIDWQ